jgi:hypothetical protein
MPRVSTTVPDTELTVPTLEEMGYDDPGLPVRLLPSSLWKVEHVDEAFVPPDALPGGRDRSPHADEDAPSAEAVDCHLPEGKFETSG